jgi:ATP-dependent DNA helicase RecG
MNNEIRSIIANGENISIEFKKAKNKLPKDVYETVCAFLNRNGGTIFLGVTNDGIIEGIDKDCVIQMKKDF